jgi:hypothetical protein
MYSLEIVKVGSDERFCWVGIGGVKSENMVKMDFWDMVKSMEVWKNKETWLMGMEVRVCRLLG